MNVQAGGQSQDDPNQKAKQFRLFHGARVQWPAEVPDDMLEAILAETRSTLENHELSKDPLKVAGHLKKWLDETYEPFWHVIFGRNFGTYVVHEKSKFLYFYIEKDAFLMYKAGY